MTAKKTNVGSTIAKSDDGSIQITFNIPFSIIDENKKKAANELGKNLEVPGFRKGKAPLVKVIEQIPENTLLEKTLSGILPDLVSKAIDEHKIKPAVYPRFELISAKEGENWQIRALTCELPGIKLGDYKTKIAGTSRAKAIWTPSSADPAEDKTDKEDQAKTRAEKEQAIISALLESIDINIPKLLIDEEVNSRLSRLLERLEKMGLTLESYLASISKTAEVLRSEYEKQAHDAIALDLILNKIAEKENIKVGEKEIVAAVAAGSADANMTEELHTPERRRFIEVILKRRKALDSLTALL